MVKPNTNFDFNIDELAIVEEAMRFRMNRLIRLKNIVKESHTKGIEAEIKNIYKLLGKIHNQKNWYRSKDRFLTTLTHTGDYYEQEPL
jgi:hypothetical protein